MKGYKLRKERKKRGGGEKERERIREKGREGRGTEETDCAETPVAFSSPTAKTSSPHQPGAEDLKSQVSATFSPVNVSSPPQAPACPSPLPSAEHSFPLSVRTSKDHNSGLTDYKLFLQEHLAMGFPSPKSILGMSIASVWHKNAESIFLINNYIVISCHSDGG